MDKLKAWWRAAPEWQRRIVIGAVSALLGLVLGAVVF